MTRNHWIFINRKLGSNFTNRHHIRSSWQIATVVSWDGRALHHGQAVVPILELSKRPSMSIAIIGAKASRRDLSGSLLSGRNQWDIGLLRDGLKRPMGSAENSSSYTIERR